MCNKEQGFYSGGFGPNDVVVDELKRAELINEAHDLIDELEVVIDNMFDAALVKVNL